MCIFYLSIRTNRFSIAFSIILNVLHESSISLGLPVLSPDKNLSSFFSISMFIGSPSTLHLLFPRLPTYKATFAFPSSRDYSRLHISRD